MLRDYLESYSPLQIALHFVVFVGSLFLAVKLWFAVLVVLAALMLPAAFATILNVINWMVTPRDEWDHRYDWWWR